MEQRAEKYYRNDEDEDDEEDVEEGEESDDREETGESDIDTKKMMKLILGI